MRNYMIFNTSELPLINFEEVMETSADTVRKSADGTKTFVKWSGSIPESVNNLTTKEGPYTDEEIRTILATEEWTVIYNGPGIIVVPREVAAWRIRAITTVMGLESQIATILNSFEEPNKTIANYAWFQGTTIERYSPTVTFIASQLNLTESEIDNIFIQASEIVI